MSGTLWCSEGMHYWYNAMPGSRCLCGEREWQENGEVEHVVPVRRAWAYFGAGAVVHEPCVVLKPEAVGVGDGARVDAFVKIEGGLGVTLGKCVHVCSFCHVNEGGGRVTVGDHACLASGAVVMGGTNLADAPSMSAASPPAMQHVWRAETVIGERAFVGARAVVLPGVKVGRCAVVGAGAVVTHDVPEREVWVGVPARFLCLRADEARP
jgi:acetyltransferase-like isoleucine patch superfamily enzyme